MTCFRIRPHFLHLGTLSVDAMKEDEALMKKETETAYHGGVCVEGDSSPEVCAALGVCLIDLR